MTNICPCCGAATQKPILVDLSHNRVSAGGKITTVRPKVAELLSILVDAHPGTVNRDSLLYRLYGAHSEPGGGVISVYVTWARKALEGTGWQIKSVWGNGYGLAREE